MSDSRTLHAAKQGSSLKQAASGAEPLPSCWKPRVDTELSVLITCTYVAAYVVTGHCEDVMTLKQGEESGGSQERGSGVGRVEAKAFEAFTFTRPLAPSCFAWLLLPPQTLSALAECFRCGKGMPKNVGWSF